MYHFTLLERMVLESVNKGDKNLNDIQKDTGLELKICGNVLRSLLAKNLVLCRQDLYQFNSNLSEQILAELKNQQNLAVEINALVRECVKMALLNGEESFKFKKVYMNESEKKLLNAMLYNVESFLDGLKSNKNGLKKGATKEETFVFWGGENYAKAVNSYIS